MKLQEKLNIENLTFFMMLHLHSVKADRTDRMLFGQAKIS
jgi:hypothetical protein